MPLPRFVVGIVAITGTLGALSSCESSDAVHTGRSGEPTPASDQRPPSPDIVSFQDTMAQRIAAPSRANGYRPLQDYLTNRRWGSSEVDSVPVSELVAIGRIVAVDRGRGGLPDGTYSDFDHPDAIWRTIHFRLEVNEVIGNSKLGEPRSVDVGLAIGPDLAFATVVQGLTDMDEILLFLERSPVFGYDDNRFGILLDGGLLAAVSQAGSISLPFLTPADASLVLASASTVGALEVEAAEPPQIVDPRTGG